MIIFKMLEYINLFYGKFNFFKYFIRFFNIYMLYIYMNWGYILWLYFFYRYVGFIDLRWGIIFCNIYVYYSVILCYLMY